MSFLSLPNELLYQIASLLARRDLNSFSRSCTKLHQLLTNKLYHREVEEGQSAPFSWAAVFGSLPTMRRAIREGVTLSPDMCSHAVFLAISHGNTDCLEILLDSHPFEINSTWHGHNSALILAIHNGPAQMVKLLLERGADPTLTELSFDELSPLHVAARRGDAEIIKMLLEAGAFVDARNGDDESPLLNVIQRGGVLDSRWYPRSERVVSTDEEVMETARLFIESGCTMDAADGNAYLYEACWQGRTTLVRFLLSLGADPHRQTESPQTCLGVAAMHGHTDVVQILLYLKVEVNTTSKYGFAPLVEAVRLGELDAIKLLVERGGGDVNFADGHGNTPLHVALSPGVLANGIPRYMPGSEGRVPQPKPPFNEGLVRYLIDRGADVHAVTSKGISMLSVAVSYSNDAIVAMLLKEGAITGAADEILRLIIRAAYSKKEATAKRLLQQESAADLDCSKLYPALHAACKNEDLEIVKLLVETGADVNALDEKGQSCLQLAINHDQICQFLIEHGADVEQQLNWGYTALLFAVEYGLLDTVDVLINAGADITVCNDSKQNALMIASQYGHRYLTKQFLGLDSIDINAQCIDGRTALHYAAMRSRRPIVDMLLSHSQPPALRLKDTRGVTPLIAAARQVDLEVVKRILTAGDSTLLEDEDRFGYTALQWAGMQSLAIKEFLLAATLEAGLDPDPDTDEPPQDGDFHDQCACDACGRARTGPRINGVEECRECLTNMGEPFVLCQWCLAHGETCRDETHGKHSYYCMCNANYFVDDY